VRLTREDRRTEIVRAAEGLFAELGYAEATIDAIAARAGVSAPVVYDHFASKAELHLTLLRERGPAILEAVAERIARERDAEARLRAGIDAFFAFAREHPFTWRMLFRDPPSDARVLEQSRRQQAETTRALAGLLRADAGAWAEQEGNLDQASEVLAEFLKTGLNGLAGWWWEHPEVSRDRLVDLVMSAIWTGFETLHSGETMATRSTTG
jgi:AcrR family transcriptional regulator